MSRTFGADVAIVGGGIGGLTTAIALQQRGIDARVYEAAPVLTVVGAGIWVPPNAVEVLDRLGLAEAVMEAGAGLIATGDSRCVGRPVTDGGRLRRRASLADRGACQLASCAGRWRGFTG